MARITYFTRFCSFQNNETRRESRILRGVDPLVAVKYTANHVFHEVSTTESVSSPEARALSGHRSLHLGERKTWQNTWFCTHPDAEPRFFTLTYNIIIPKPYVFAFVSGRKSPWTDRPGTRRWATKQRRSLQKHRFLNKWKTTQA